jgi:hypothetical protein
MGLDMSYQAVVPETVLLKLVLGNAQAEFYFKLFGYDELPDWAAYRLDNDVELKEYSQIAEIARSEHPGIEDRKLELDRRWDMLHYLLSEKRRKNFRYDEKDLIDLAIHGGDKLGDAFVLPQGVPITFLRPDEVKEISKHLGEIPLDSLLEHWNPPLMREAGVYKIRGDEDEHRLEYLLEDFENMKDFYLWTAIYDEAVVVFCD